MARAGDAIKTRLMAYMEDRLPIPVPSSNKHGLFAALPALTEAKLAMYSAMRGSRVSKAGLARRLNCHPPQVDRLPGLRHRSRLAQLAAAFRVLGKRLAVEIAAWLAGAGGVRALMAAASPPPVGSSPGR
jgi:antitoxin HicB